MTINIGQNLLNVSCHKTSTIKIEKRGTLKRIDEELKRTRKVGEEHGVGLDVGIAEEKRVLSTPQRRLSENAGLPVGTIMIFLAHPPACCFD